MTRSDGLSLNWTLYRPHELSSLFSFRRSYIRFPLYGDPRRDLDLIRSQCIADPRCGTCHICLHTLTLHRHPPHLPFRHFPTIKFRRITTRTGIAISSNRIIIRRCYPLSMCPHPWENLPRLPDHLWTQASSVSNFSAIYKSCLHEFFNSAGHELLRSWSISINHVKYYIYMWI